MIEKDWIEDFNETRQDILEDAFLLDALSLYVINNGGFMHDAEGSYFPRVFNRLCNYLSQHALELHRLQKMLDLKSGI